MKLRHTVLAIAAVSAVSLTAAQVMQTPKPPPMTEREAATFDAFHKRVAAYLEIRQKAAAPLPKLPDKATPEEIDSRQRALLKLVIVGRPNAKEGDIFGPEMSDLIRRRFQNVFKGTDGVKLRSLILDEPQVIVPAVNDRYPDVVPLSTMPPDVLVVLPKLENDLEFRFIGRHLILLDVQAHLVVDMVRDAMPR